MFQLKPINQHQTLITLIRKNNILQPCSFYSSAVYMLREWRQKLFTLGIYEIRMELWLFCCFTDRLPSHIMQYIVNFLIRRGQSIVGILEYSHATKKIINVAVTHKRINYVGLSFWIYASWIKYLNVLKMYFFLPVVQYRIPSYEMQEIIFASCTAGTCVVLYVKMYCKYLEIHICLSLGIDKLANVGSLLRCILYTSVVG
jgi:hypothetical protein